MTRNTPDISEHLYFGFYDHVSYKDNDRLGMTAIESWIGVSQRVGVIMSYWIMTQKGMVISITTVKQLTSLDNETDKIKASVS